MKPWEKYQAAPEPEAGNGPWAKYAQPAVPEEPYSFSPLNMVKNIPGSGAGLVNDTYTALSHPIDTMKGLINIGGGGIQKLIPGEQPLEANWDAAVDYYGDRYGSWENALKSLESDPLGVLTDFSAGLGTVGKVGKMDRVTRAAGAIDPLNATINAGTTAASGLLGRNRPGQWYQSSAKINPTAKRTPERIQRDINTALDENIMPTEGGLQRIRGIVGDIDARITDAINAATDSGGTVNRQALYKHLKQVRQDLGQINIDAPQNLQAIDNIISGFEQHMDAIGKNSLTAMELHNFKKSLYRSIDFDRAQGAALLPREETLKAVARSAREGVEGLVPSEDIRALNARQGRLLSLRESIEKPAGRIERRDAIGIGAPIKALTGEAVGGKPGALFGLMQGIMDAPKPKAWAAIQLHNAQNAGLLGNMSRQLLQPYYRSLLTESGQLYQNEMDRQWAQEYPSVFNTGQ